MLTGTRKEAIIQPTPHRTLNADSGVPARRRALEDSSANLPGQARNGVNRGAGDQDLRGEPGLWPASPEKPRRLRERLKPHLIPCLAGRPALGQAVAAACSIFTQTAKGGARYLLGLNAGVSCAKVR